MVLEREVVVLGWEVVVLRIEGGGGLRERGVA